MRLNGIKETGTQWGVFLNSNHSLLKGIKQTMYFLGAIRIKWRFWDPHDRKFGCMTFSLIIFGYLNSISNVSLIFSETINRGKKCM